MTCKRSIGNTVPLPQTAPRQPRKAKREKFCTIGTCAMATLLTCLRTDCYSTFIRNMLETEDALPLLQLAKSPELKQVRWACRLREATARIRRVMDPLKTTQLRFPGFARAVTISCRKAAKTSDAATSIQNYLNLLAWMEANDFAGYTPSETVLMLNAWPKSTRDTGAELSDFLEETNTAFYFMTNFQEPGKFRANMCTKTWCFFTYDGLAGVLETQDTTP